jgi:preprotein translocase subunit SecG
MSALGILMIIVHVLLAIGVIFFSLKRMQRNSELGGAFGGGASQANFGRWMRMLNGLYGLVYYSCSHVL